MRKYLATSLALFLIGLLCCAQSPSAGFPPGTFQSRAGLDGSVAPTVLHLTDPNNFSAASWTAFSATAVGNAALAPDGVSNTASIITSSTSISFAALRTTIPITMVSGTLYSITGSIKSNVAPVWAEILIFDGVGPSVEAWIDTTSGSGAAGTSSTSGGVGGVIDSWAASHVGNGYTQVTLVFHFTSTPTAANLIDIRFVDSDGGTTPTTTQSYFVWGWGQ